MKKRVLAMALTGLLAVGCMAGCGSSASSNAASSAGSSAAASTSSGGSKDLTFAYVVRDTGSIFSQYITQFNEACEEYGVEPMIISYEGDDSKWTTALENAVTKGADAVYTWPDDQSMADAAGQYFAAEGVPNCSMGIASDYADCSMVADQEQMGRDIADIATDWVKENLGDEPFEWAVLQYTDAEHVASRSKGIEEQFEANNPNGEKVAVLEAATLDEGMDQTENLLQMHPDVQVLLCCEDPAAMGAVEIFRGAGKTGDQYAIFGTCFGDQVGDAIIKGDVYRASIAFGNTAEPAVKELKKICEGEEPEKLISCDFLPVTPDNVEEMMEYFGYEVKK